MLDVQGREGPGPGPAICNELDEKVDSILALGAEWTEDGAVASP
jgi:hypothetical protein